MHREVFEDGMDWAAMLGDPGELAEDKVLSGWMELIGCSALCFGGHQPYLIIKVSKVRLKPAKSSIS